MHGQFLAFLWFRSGWWKVLKWWYADSPTLSVYDFQMCFSLCMCASLPSRCVQSSVVLRARDLCRSNSVGLISYTHKHITVFVFLAGQHPFTLHEAWLMQSPLKCWYKIRLLCATVIKSLGTGINTWNSLYSMAFLHVINSYPKHFLEEKKRLVWLTLQLDKFSL